MLREIVHAFYHTSIDPCGEHVNAKGCENQADEPTDHGHSILSQITDDPIPGHKHLISAETHKSKNTECYNIFNQ